MGGHRGGVIPRWAGIWEVGKCTVKRGEPGNGEEADRKSTARGQRHRLAMQTLPGVINPSAGAAAGFRHWEAIWDFNEGRFPGVLATETRLQ